MSDATVDTDNWDAVRRESEAALTPEIVALITRARADEHPEGHLINVLHRVQAHFGYLGAPQMNAVAQLLGVPASRVTGVATFYHYFRLQPHGRFAVNCCMGTACYVRGGDRVAERFKEELGIDFGQLTADGQFSLDSAACLGTCGLAPVVMVNDRVFAEVTPDRVPSLLEKAKREQGDS
jgi:NADH:ubiquinone oxidoreductase subunit E